MKTIKLKFIKNVLPLRSQMFPYGCKVCIGKMAEWSNAAVLKTVEQRCSGGSNPSLSPRRAIEDLEGLLHCARHRLATLVIPSLQNIVGCICDQQPSPPLSKGDLGGM